MHSLSLEAFSACAPVSRSHLTSCPVPPSDFNTLHKIVQMAYQSAQLTVQQIEELPNHLHHVRLLHLSNGCRLIMKANPSSSVRLLRHERLGLEAEALTLNLLGRYALPVPSLVKYERNDKSGGPSFLLTTHFQGTPISKAKPFLSMADSLSIQHQASDLVTTIAQQKSLTFGELPMVACGQGFRSWREAFRSMMESLLRDAEDMFVNLPYSQIREQFRRTETALDDVLEARLVVLGLAEPDNILIDVRTKQITGIVDFKRALWGDVQMGEDPGLIRGGKGLL